MDKKYELRSELADIFRHRKVARALYLESGKRRRITFDAYVLNDSDITLKRKGIVLKTIPLDAIMGVY